MVKQARDWADKPGTQHLSSTCTSPPLSDRRCPGSMIPGPNQRLASRSNTSAPSDEQVVTIAVLERQSTDSTLPVKPAGLGAGIDLAGDAVAQIKQRLHFTERRVYNLRDKLLALRAPSVDAVISRDDFTVFEAGWPEQAPQSSQERSHSARGGQRPQPVPDDRRCCDTRPTAHRRPC